MKTKTTIIILFIITLLAGLSLACGIEGSGTMTPAERATQAAEYLQHPDLTQNAIFREINATPTPVTTISVEMLLTAYPDKSREAVYQTQVAEATQKAGEK